MTGMSRCTFYRFDPNLSSCHHLSHTIITSSFLLSLIHLSHLWSILSHFHSVFFVTSFLLSCFWLRFISGSLCSFHLNPGIKANHRFNSTEADECTSVQELMSNLWMISEPLSLLWLSPLLRALHLERWWRQTVWHKESRRRGMKSRDRQKEVMSITGTKYYARVWYILCSDLF